MLSSLRRSAALLALALTALLGACASSDFALPEVMPPDFFVGVKVQECTDPPVDYLIKIERGGKANYEATVRSPVRKSFSGTVELSEDQIVGLYQAVRDAGFEALDDAYEPMDGAAPDQRAGKRIFYAFSDGLDKRVDANLVAVPELDRVQKAILAAMPEGLLSGKGVVADRWHPSEFIGDKASKAFHLPSCEEVGRIPPGSRETFGSEYDALDYGYHPCGACRPLDTKKHR